MSILKDQVAVITGASGGIGKSIALRLAKIEVKLCLLGRNLERLQVQPEDIARVVTNVLSMPRSAEVTDFNIRPFLKT